MSRNKTEVVVGEDLHRPSNLREEEDERRANRKSERVVREEERDEETNLSDDLLVRQRCSILMTPSVHGEVLTGDVSSLEEDSVVSDDVRSDVKVSCRDVLSLEVLV